MTLEEKIYSKVQFPISSLIDSDAYADVAWNKVSSVVNNQVMGTTYYPVTDCVDAILAVINLKIKEYEL